MFDFGKNSARTVAMAAAFVAAAETVEAAPLFWVGAGVAVEADALRAGLTGEIAADWTDEAWEFAGLDMRAGGESLYWVGSSADAPRDALAMGRDEQDLEGRVSRISAAWTLEGWEFEGVGAPIETTKTAGKTAAPDLDAVWTESIETADIPAAPRPARPLWDGLLPTPAPKRAERPLWDGLLD